MDLSLLMIPGAALGRALFGWLENALADGKVDLPEWRKLGETVVRMGVPMVALVWGLNMPPELAAGLVTIFDILIVKIYNSKNKKK